MSVALYMDVHVRKAATVALRRLGVDVLTAQEDGHATVPDNDLLDRASHLGRTLVSEDQDFLVETDRRQRSGEFFAGLVHVRQKVMTTGKLIRDLELIATVYDSVDMANRVEYLPL